MATTYEPEGDPAFLAYERARQYGEGTLQRNASTDQTRADEDVQRSAIGLEMEQTQRVDNNMGDFRSRGFGQSGLRAQEEDRIRQDIALRLGGVVSGYQRTSNDIAMDLADALARSGFEREEEALAARKRLTTDNASSGVGI